MSQTENSTLNPRTTLDAFHLELTITEPEVVQELARHSSPSDQEEFALTAMRVGVLAIKQASGVLDSRAIREEGERLLRSVADALGDHSRGVTTQVSNLLIRYFDPANGELPQRLDRLLRRDGELETVLGRHLNGDGSSLTQTLDKHIGASSPLLRLLAPDEAGGFLTSLRAAMELVLSDQNKQIVGQFSLDDRNSALSRLVAEMTEKNGGLRRDLAEDLEKVHKEFSLDNSDGALARLVARVEKANGTILDEFSIDNKESALSRISGLLESTNQGIQASLSLDEDQSPLSRLRRELLKVFQEMEKGNREFQEQVRVSLETLRARREESARSTTHGFAFEDEVDAFVSREARRLNDLVEVTKDTTGAITRCKMGDYVQVLGPETAAPDARIVFEAKEDKSYDLKKALADLQKARDNRQAEVGIFVFSRESAPDGIEPLTRWGKDLVLVWDAQDPATDIVFKAAISVARMIAVHERSQSDQAAADIAKMKEAIETMCRDVSILDDISRVAGNAKTHCETIITKSTGLKKKIETQLDRLKEHIQRVAVVGHA